MNPLRRSVVNSVDVFVFLENFQGFLEQFVALGRGELSRTAAQAEGVLTAADCRADVVNRQVSERVGAEVFCHTVENVRREFAFVSVLKEMRSEQVAQERHVNAVEARGDNRRAGDSQVNFRRAAHFAQHFHQSANCRGTDDAVVNQNDFLAA